MIVALSQAWCRRVRRVAGDGIFLRRHTRSATLIPLGGRCGKPSSVPAAGQDRPLVIVDENGCWRWQCPPPARSGHLPCWLANHPSGASPLRSLAARKRRGLADRRLGDQRKRRRRSSSLPVGGSPGVAVGRFAATASRSIAFAHSVSVGSTQISIQSDEPRRRATRASPFSSSRRDRIAAFVSRTSSVCSSSKCAISRRPTQRAGPGPNAPSPRAVPPAASLQDPRSSACQFSPIRPIVALRGRDT